MAARKRWIQCRQTGQLIPEEEYGQGNKQESAQVIQDSMEPTWHPAADVIIDSKSKFRELTKREGCVEVGNERTARRAPEKKKDPTLRRDLERAYSNLNG